MHPTTEDRTSARKVLGWTNHKKGVRRYWSEYCPVLIIVPLDGGSRCIHKVQMSSRRSVGKEFNSICAVWEGFMEEVPLASGL